MRDGLTALELGGRIGEPVERVNEWRALGLIGGEGAETFSPEDVQRARLVQLLLRRGFGIEAIAQADREEGFLARHVVMNFPEGVGPTYSLAEAAERLGLGVDVVRRFWEAAGLAEQGELLYERDVETLDGIKTGLHAGLPEEALLQLVRVYADTLGRVAEAESRIFHFYVHERLKALGLTGRQLADAEQGSGDQVTPLIEPTILYFHRKGWEKAMREDAVLHVRPYAGQRETGEVPGQLRVAIAFVDLSGFTSLAEAMGDQMAARVLERFSRLVREAVSHFDGRVVKQIGDAFMLVFPEPRSAVACAVEIERLAAEEPQFPAVRLGIHHGQVLYREGDYLGTSVNVAARLAADAEPRQLLLTAAARKEAGSLPNVDFVPLGKRRLRGLAEDHELFAAVPRAATEGARRLVDPVCRMELAAGEAAARLSFEGREQVFCSQQCLQRFVAAPERYAAPAPDA